MKTKSGKAKRLVIPTSPLISDIEDLFKGILTQSEIKTFNTYSYYLNLGKTSRHLKEWPDYCATVLSCALRKLKFLYDIKSPEKFKQGILTRHEFLNAPIEVHGFSTRLYHQLKDLQLFNFQELLDLGSKALKSKYGIGDKMLREIYQKLRRKGYGDLFNPKNLTIKNKFKTQRKLNFNN